MTTLYPGADYQPLGPQTEPLMTAHDIVCLHTMVGSLISTDNYFEQDGYGGVESHFGVGYDGKNIQWQDLDRQADANLQGNPRLISIETADSGTGFPVWDHNGSNVPAWTEAQLDEISQCIAWLCRKYSIPAQLVPDSKPGRRGIGYHRQGINPWRVDGGELWSESNGKVCPGDRRILQLKTIVIPRVQDILEGNVVEAKDVWLYGLLVPGSDPPQNVTAGGMLRTVYSDVKKALTRLGDVKAELDSITTKLNEISNTLETGAALTPQQVEDAAYTGSKEALSEAVDVQVTVSVLDTP